MEKIYVWKYNGDATTTGKICQYIFFIPIKDSAGDYVLVGESDFDPLLLPGCGTRSCIPLSTARTYWKELQQEGNYSLLKDAQ